MRTNPSEARGSLSTMLEQRPTEIDLPIRLREVRALAGRFSKLIETAATGSHLIDSTREGWLADSPEPCVAVDADWLAMFTTVGSQLGELLHHGVWSAPLLREVPANERDDLEKEWANEGPQLIKAKRYVHIANTLITDFLEA